MKFKFSLFIFALFFLFGCENPYFRELSGVYEVKFESNGGTPVDIVNASIIKTAPVTTRTGYSFDGWGEYSDGSGKKNFPFEPESNITLYAKWIKKSSTQDSQDSGNGDSTGSTSTDTSSGEPETADSNDSTITETLTYTLDTDWPGVVNLAWTPSEEWQKKYGRRSPLLYKNDSQYAQDPNFSIALWEGTYTFYLVSPWTEKRVSNIITVTITESAY